MAVRNTVQYLVIRHFNCSKKEAKDIIASGNIVINNEPIHENKFVQSTDNVHFNDIILQKAKQYTTVLFYKPAGIETTQNEAIADSLYTVLPATMKGLFPIGRLDKASEGLLVLTDDGQLYRKLNHYQSNIEKTYIVRVDKAIDNDFIDKMASGIEIMGYMTKPCKVTPIDDFSFNIILTEGKNRQIRRMCYKLGYEVLMLKRISLGTYELGDLTEGAYRVI